MKKYTEADKNRILDLQKEGKRPKEIHELTGASEKYIRKIVHQYANQQSQIKLIQQKYRPGLLKDWRVAMRNVRYEDYVGLEYP